MDAKKKENQNHSDVKIEFASDAALLISFENCTTLIESNHKVLNLFRKLQNQTMWPITNLHPAYTSCLIEFDLSQCDPLKLKRDLGAWIENENFEDSITGDLIQIPVQYGGEDGPDLEDVAQLTGLSPKEVIELHSSVEYTVAFLGFAPGFPYLLGLPEKLQCPRKKTPRLRVLKGSVAVAGLQTGIYPVASPGGWQLIGRTEALLFDPSRASPTLFKPGDKVVFVPQSKSSSQTFKQNKSRAEESNPQRNILRVDNPGFFSTVQNRGLDERTHLGISPGGAADPMALKVGQQLVGNSAEAAAIECTSQGGVYTFLQDTWFAITGADCHPHFDQQRIKMWTAIPVSAGQRLVMNRMQNGLRSYLHVHGGIGGELGRTLAHGDELPSGEQMEASPCFRRCRTEVRSLYEGAKVQILRVTRAPQWEWFSSSSVRDFFSQEFEVSNEVNRLGLRITGPVLTYKKEFKDRELISEGLADGAIQVSTGGQPMILFCEQRTTGGYPKIANVIQADRFCLGQLSPGQKIQFQLVDMKKAWELNFEMQQSLQSLVEKF